ncbi:MAG TPA: PhnD/SsuA/transferrin family substrate-binding protein [Xanthobacteraceae bacterium]|nr:PhnD/SsuA/transferrin family substrate-binding protein [Xanthobacteraceae bacterium]
MILAANARMYAVTPAVKAAWQELFAWVAKESGVPLSYLDHAAPAPLETLWTRGDLGAAFMCGFPFAAAPAKPQALAAPIPSPPRYGGKPQYCTDFTVRADSAFTQLGDTFGRRIGWTVEHSQSGYQAVRNHLAALRAAHDAQWVGPLVTPRRVIDALLAGEIDVGPLDSYVHDLLQRHEPATAAMLRVIESTAMTPIPLLVASPGVADDAVARLRQTLLSCHREPELAATLDTLLLARFVAVDPADYEVLLARKGVSSSPVPPP